VDSAVDEFKTEVTDSVNKYNRYVSELLDAYNRTVPFDSGFTPTIDIKSGIDWPMTIFSVAAIIAGVIISGLTGPVGWVVLALGLVELGIIFKKAIGKAADPKQRKSQQKKAADDTIKKMGNTIIESVKANLKNNNEPLRDGIANIKDGLQKSVNHIKMMNGVFSNAEARLKSLTIEVDAEGAR
jgi:hypothetical protein